MIMDVDWMKIHNSMLGRIETQESMWENEKNAIKDEVTMKY
jgi:hypothetical protein